MITDEPTFAAAIAAANLGKVRTTLELSGNVTISKPYTITAPVSLRGPARLTYTGNGSFTWSGTTTGWYTLQAKELGETCLTDAPVGLGSYLLMQSNDILPVDPHVAGGSQHPQELHLVNYSKAGTIGVESFTQDRMAGNCSILTPIDNISISDLELVFDDKVQKSYSTAIRWNGVTNGRIENVRSLRNGPGAFWLNNCYACRVQCRIDGTVATDNVYGLVVGTVNDVVFDGCTITGCRHAFTTTAGTTQGNARWGTPLNVTLSNSTINVPTKLEISPNSTRAGVDSHGEGYGFTARNVTVNIGTSTANYGAFIRSRAPRFLGCTFNGGANSKAIEIYGSDAIVDHCVINGAWIGVATKKIRNETCSHASVTNTLFRNVTGPACYFEAGSGHVIHNLAFDRVMTKPGPKFAAHTTPVIGYHQLI